MAKQFARIAKDIAMTVKSGGPDPGSNPALRRVIQNARAVNMPKDKVEAAIKRASGRDATNYHEAIYEGYAPHGVALMVETATDNPTRTVAHVRNIISKHGGNLGTTGSVGFQFRKMGVFRLDPAGIDQDSLELDMIDHGLQEMGESSGEKGEPQLVLRCEFADFGRLQEALEARRSIPCRPSTSTSASSRSNCPRRRRPRCSNSSTCSSRTTTCSGCSTRSPEPHLTAPARLCHTVDPVRK